MNANRTIVFSGLLAAALLAGAALTAAESSTKAPKRFGSVIGVRPEKLAEYKRLHAAVWPEVAKAIQAANIRNFSIYLRKLDDGNDYLFSYFEYVGQNFPGDMAKMAVNPDVKRWWTFTDACQKPLSGRKEGEWWAAMEEVFHQD